MSLSSDFFEYSKTAISIDSAPTHGTIDIVNYYSELAKKLGLEATIYKELADGVEHGLLVIQPKSETLNDKNVEEFLIMAPLESRDPGSYMRWTKTGANPFQLSVDGDHLYGLGIVNKASFLTLLMSLKDLSDKKLKAKPILVGTYNSESGISAIKFLRKKIARPKWAFVNAPTKNKICFKGPGYAILEIVLPYSEKEKDHLQGQNIEEISVSQTKLFTSRDGILPSDKIKENPIVSALNYLGKLPGGIIILSIEGGSSAMTYPNSASLEVDFIEGLGFTQNLKLLRLGKDFLKFDEFFSMMGRESNGSAVSKFNVGKIRTSQDGITIQGSCILSPDSDIKDYETWLSQLESTCLEIGAVLSVKDYKAPFHLEKASSKGLYEVISDLSFFSDAEKTERQAGGSSEANVLNRFGISSFVFGPGKRKDYSLVENESLSIQELIEYQESCALILKRICL